MRSQIAVIAVGGFFMLWQPAYTPVRNFLVEFGVSLYSFYSEVTLKWYSYLVTFWSRKSPQSFKLLTLPLLNREWKHSLYHKQSLSLFYHYYRGALSKWNGYLLREKKICQHHEQEIFWAVPQNCYCPLLAQLQTHTKKLHEHQKQLTIVHFQCMLAKNSVWRLDGSKQRNSSNQSVMF